MENIPTQNKRQGFEFNRIVFETLEKKIADRKEYMV